MVKKMGKRGDTLVEVMLAVGIFSMVAVAVVAVMSGGTSSSQTALETTLAREEIDNQAEALRFIHDAYTIEAKRGENGKFKKLWQAVTGLAINGGSSGDLDDSKVLNYNPSTCKELYNNGKNASESAGEAYQHGFIINPSGMAGLDAKKDDTIKNVLISAKQGSKYYKEKIFKEASTYPHLFYAKDESDTELLEHSDATKLYRAEGIYVIAVKDPSSTSLAGAAGNKDSAYYDFYIRTCWYGTGDQSPSSISTVIRLYNPDIAASEGS